MLLQHLLPKQALTRLAGAFASARLGGLTQWAIRRFIARYGVTYLIGLDLTGDLAARYGLTGLLRNAAIVLGNQRDASSIPALTKGLVDPEPLVREACAWALARISAAYSVPGNTAAPN